MAVINLPQGRERPEQWTTDMTPYNSENPVDEFIRRKKSFPYCGRLIALPTSANVLSKKTFDFLVETSVDFPAMPDSIELARQAEYYVLNSMLTPDGVHQYKWTTPLVIPFSFRLHAFDEEFCPEGALTLLKLAARLHAFILPINLGKDDVEIQAQIPGAPAAPGNDATNQESRAESTEPIALGGFENVDRIYNPVTLRLEIIFTKSEGPGIACTGYIKSVNVKLNGPWMRGPEDSTNLPTSADFSFEFVHRPGHYNTLGFQYAMGQAKPGSDLRSQPQAFAHTVKSFFYNTRHLAKVPSYAGFR
jgi:hypothetical protein